MEIIFLLNGETVRLNNADNTTTLLDWLRNNNGLTGSKEGCNEGDCGACTVIVTDKFGARTFNSCILFLPQLHGKAVRTVEGISGPNKELHPVQAAMIKHHGSQCGFCTPGFIAALSCAHLNGEKNYNDTLAGNLCRCTGYAPIVRAAEAASAEPVPDWMYDRLPQVSDHPSLPHCADTLAKWYSDNPDGTLIGGATDVALWVTKDLKELKKTVFLHHCKDLQKIKHTEDGIYIGAAVTMDRLAETMVTRHPSYAELIRRYGSQQVRNAATIGGNIANASPIGDNPPALIALDATLHLRQLKNQREIPIEDFFIAYGQQNRSAGEFLEAVTIPHQEDRLKVYKLSKRFDQDISSVCGAFNIHITDGVVSKARIAFGGLAEIPKRAHFTEQALIDQPWTRDCVINAMSSLTRDFTPISDLRASSDYRLGCAPKMLLRVWLEDQGITTSVLDIKV